MLTTIRPANDWEGGFEEQGWQSWMFLGTEDQRRMVLFNGQGMHLHSLAPDIASARFAPGDQQHWSERQVIIEAGLITAGTVIEVRQGSRVKGRLHVGVYRPRQVKVNFYLVKDKPGQLPRFNGAMAQYFMKKITHLHRYQTNLSFSTHLVFDDVPIDFDFSKPGPTNDQKLYEMLKAKQRELDPSPHHYHVFWVKDLSIDDTVTSDTQGETFVDPDTNRGDVIVLEDTVYWSGEIVNLAHELCHALGANHDDGHDDALMNSANNNGGRKIYKDTLEQMRGTVHELTY
jgi:hypothetical protein